MNATHIVWKGAGSPHPFDSDGASVREYPVTTPCAHCGEIDARFRLRDAISDNFTTVKNRSRAWPFGGDRLCAACVFAAKALALKCSLWFAREDGIWLVGTRPLTGWPQTRPDTLAALLNPPEPPFVAGYGAYGIDHGGEANVHRCWWPDGHPRPEPLVKLQSKHVAIYARVGTSRTRYPLQVDDTGDVVVDVQLWSRLRVVCDALLVELRAGGVGAMDARECLVSLRPPPRCPVALVATWPRRVEPLRPHAGAPWWPVFTNLLLMPELTEQPKPSKPETKKAKPSNEQPRTARRPDSSQRNVPANAPAAGVSTARNANAHDPRAAGRAPIQGTLW
jgi:hypothetical protein